MWRPPQWLREKIFDVWIHHKAESLHQTRKAYQHAQASTGVNTYQGEVSLPGTKTEINNKGGGLGTVAAVLGSGLAGAGIVAAALSYKPSTPAGPPAIQVEDAKAKVELYYEDADGNLHPLPAAGTPMGAQIDIKRD